MAAKKTLSNRLTNRYLLIIRNEENFAEKTTLSFTYAKVVLIIFGISLIMLGIAIYLVTSVLDEWFDPRHAQNQAKIELIQLTQTVDSLENQVRARENYIENVRKIMTGQDDVYANVEERELSEEQIESSSALDNDITPVDKEFRKEFERETFGTLTSSLRDNSEALKEMFLFSPLGKEGLVSDKYDPKINHYGVDIVAKKDEPVKAVADGTVILASWTQDSGYVIGIQHRGNLISIYKHNSDLLKNVGNFVSAGEIISIIGNTGELTSGPHLHFELWYNGSPVDPEEFVDF